VVVRHFEQYDPEEVEKSTVEVYSAYLRKTLAKVIPTYPSISFQTEVRQPHILNHKRLTLKIAHFPKPPG
jgi:hypothetical protein